MPFSFACSACLLHHIPNIATQHGWYHPAYLDIVFSTLGCLSETIQHAPSLTFSEFSQKNQEIQMRVYKCNFRDIPQTNFS